MGGMAAHDGKVYFVNCNSESERKNLSLYVTVDNGISWKNIATISEPAGYSDITISPDGNKIYILFEEFFYQNGNSSLALDRCSSQNLVFVSLDIPVKKEVL